MDNLQALLDSAYAWHSCILWASLFLMVVLGYTGAPFVLWAVAILAFAFSLGAGVVTLAVIALVSLIFVIKPIRRVLVSSGVMKVMRNVLPKISETERTALEAGVVWVEKELFSGKLNFSKLKKEPYPELSQDERAFIDGPAEKLCEMINDWEVWQKREIPEEAWEYLKKEKFLGMVIPKEYGGLGFSALAHGAVVEKISSRSIPLGVSVMVPNSLGPAELLVHYGTQAQKDRLLPKLAVGEEIPCFGLTEPNAGSDAGNVSSQGVVFKGADGKLKLRLDWNKRWITLAAISTTIGLAVRIKDPDGLLGDKEELGITCVLVPSSTPGVVIGNRHDPLGVPFYNCPTQGKNVEVDLEDCVVGGENGIGQGWSMLMDCLGAGRGISLPSQSTGGGKTAFLATSSHSVVRRQFGLPIGKFEGVEEPLALVGGLSYMMEACRTFTAGAIDRGITPPVVTAIAKYQTTEAYRKVIIAAMDIVGGAAISKGPRNTLAHGYIAAPISITVEGANILTRTLMIFGQGALRAHPYAYQEVKSAEEGNVKAFDKAFWSHIGHVVRNMFRSVLLSFTRGYLGTGFQGGALNSYYRKLTWTSASFAIMADIAMGSLGGALKVKEKITGRYADILSWMYLNLAIIRKYEAEGSKKEDLVFAQYALDYGFSEIQKAFEGIFDNLKVPGLTWFFKGVVGRWARFNSLSKGPSDSVGHRLCKAMLSDSEQRQRLTDGVFKPNSEEPGFGKLEAAFKLCKKAEEAEKKVKTAMKKKELPKSSVKDALDQAVEKNVISADEKDLILRAEEARWDGIQVDDFDDTEYKSYSPKSYTTGLNV